MMNLDLTDAEAAALVRLLRNAIDGDRYLVASHTADPGHPRPAASPPSNIAGPEDLRAAE
jgi:hypothetical protein